MTSEEIKKDPGNKVDIAMAKWLREIAYQLAVLNENRFETVYVYNSRSGDPR